MRNQDPRGRRGQPLQEREPLPGAQDEESRRSRRGKTPISNWFVVVNSTNNAKVTEFSKTVSFSRLQFEFVWI